jgi:hypothetical protein
MSTVDKYQDILDSRDVDSRIEELEAERDALLGALDEARTASGEAQRDGRDDVHAEEVTAAQAALDEWGDGEELAALVAFRDEADGYCSDWRYGATLVRDSYFQDYAQELADDIGALGKDTQWPHTCIDWGQAARELRADYSSAELDGVTYWFRG